MQTGPSDGRRYCSKWWEGSKRSRYTFGSIYALVGSAQSVRMRKNCFAGETTTIIGHEESAHLVRHTKSSDSRPSVGRMDVREARALPGSFRTDRSYLRALRAAELATWNALILSPGYRQMILRELTLGSQA